MRFALRPYPFYLMLIEIGWHIKWNGFEQSASLHKKRKCEISLYYILQTRSISYFEDKMCLPVRF